MGADAESDVPAARRERVEKAVQEWVKQLVDLTGRNQLLYYKTLKRGTLELTKAQRSAVSTLLAGRTVRLSNLLPPTDEQPDRHEDSLKRAQAIHRKAVAYYEERGRDCVRPSAVAGASGSTATKNSSVSHAGSRATPCAPKTRYSTR